VSAGLNQPIPILIFWLTNKIIIGIDCVRSVDINNDFLYRLATGDTKKTSFIIKKMAYQPISKTYFVVVHVDRKISKALTS
jgi:hypothetical protein